MVSNETNRPAFELILSVEGAQMVVIAGFDDGTGGYDVVAGIGETMLLPYYISVIKSCIRQLSSIKKWEYVDAAFLQYPQGNETRPTSANEEGAVP